MPTCIVNGCHHSCKKKKKYPNVVLHVFPGNMDIIKNWLQNIPQDFGDIDEAVEKILLEKKTDAYRICSDHFAPNCYFYQGIKRVLTLDAVPSISHETYSSASLPKTEISLQRTACKAQASSSGLHTSSSTQSRPTDTIKNPLLVDTGTNPDYCLNHLNRGTLTNPKFGTRSVKIQSKVATSSKFVQCELITASKPSSVFPSSSHDFLVLSTPIKILLPEQSIASLFPTTIPESPGHSLQFFERESLDVTTESIASSQETCVDPVKEGLGEPYHPSNQSLVETEMKEEEDTLIDTTTDSEFNIFSQTKDVISENKYLVYESYLDTLLMGSRCLECLNGHRFHLWDSQPKKGGMPLGNILMSAAILLSGSNYHKVNYMNKLLGLKQVCKTDHYRNERTYLFPTINNHWHQEQEKTIQELGNKPVCLSGDGQNDSPGFNAKYYIYTFIESSTKKIVSFSIDQVSKECKSVHLERETFKKALNEIRDKGVNVQMICTDLHPGRRSVMKTNYKHIMHQFDVWHFAKSVGSKVVTASKRKAFRDLAQWVSPIKKHLCWAARTCEGNKDLLMEKWLSLLYHVIGVHKWKTGKLYHKCEHEELTDDVDKRRLWMKKGSFAHLKLGEIIKSRTVMKDLTHLSEFCHISEIEVYHSNTLKYRPKSNHFFMDGMIARTQLAAIDHNRNVQRQQATIHMGEDESQVEGELRHHREYSKVKKDRVIKPVYDMKQCDFAFDILRDILCYVSGEKVFQWGIG
ncbi:hypothetical protein XELAEV_18016005mg [Xenopus laevis]|uniref:THAP-type domain-containing protein n=1 Tax=Xenopus laevis TaxID=8355 RepID=A0A974DJI8_XENLA|nr:hypothetical protein XELAEV_18016005mg [Xenopus laevis]